MSWHWLGRALGDARTGHWTRQADHWAKQYLGSDNLGTLGLGDVSALAHADLLTLLPSGASGTEVSRDDLITDLKRQLETGSTRAARDPFHAGAVSTDFDSVPHTFGLAATAQLYHRITGDSRYDAFATQQRNWALGGPTPGDLPSSSAREPRSRTVPSTRQPTSLGSLTGRGDILTGGVVNGPNAAEKLNDLNAFPAMRTCPADQGNPFAPFDGHGSRYVDHVGAWQTVESADDFTATALLSFALSTTSENSGTDHL
ncbi:hypothetical protein GCM10020000_82890 [Streptomyces olivoverticillatus]